MSLRQDDAAGMIGISENFLGKVERGGDSVQWGKVFQAMQALGLKLTVEVPDSVAEETLAYMDKYVKSIPAFKAVKVKRPGF